MPDLVENLRKYKVLKAQALTAKAMSFVHSDRSSLSNSIIACARQTNGKPAEKENTRKKWRKKKQRNRGLPFEWHKRTFSIWFYSQFQFAIQSAVGGTDDEACCSLFWQLAMPHRTQVIHSPKNEMNPFGRVRRTFAGRNRKQMKRHSPRYHVPVNFHILIPSLFSIAVVVAFVFPFFQFS